MEREQITINYDDFNREIIITRPGSNTSIHKHENYIKLITKKNGYCIQNNKIITKRKSNDICSVREQRLPQLPQIEYFSSPQRFGYCIHINSVITILTHYGIRFNGVPSVIAIGCKEERIKILSEELLFQKRYKELTEAVHVYKQKRKGNMLKEIDKHIPPDLSKIIEEYVQRN